jgi:hypothetical protein
MFNRKKASLSPGNHMLVYFLRLKNVFQVTVNIWKQEKNFKAQLDFFHQSLIMTPIRGKYPKQSPFLTNRKPLMILSNITTNRYFFGFMRGLQAEQLLTQIGKKGTFLVRLSPQGLMLTVKVEENQVLHWKLTASKSHTHVKELKLADWDGREMCFASLSDLISYYQQNKLFSETHQITLSQLAPHRDNKELIQVVPKPFDILQNCMKVLGAYCVKPSDLQLEKEVGSGYFGSVYFGKYKYSPVAIKLIHHEKHKQSLLREAVLMIKIDFHPNVVNIMKVCLDPLFTCLVMEKMQMSVQDLWRKTPTMLHLLHTKNLSLIFQGICNGLEHLHSCGILHCDLSARNILINVGENQSLYAKLCDFGIGRISTGLWQMDARKK